MKYKEIGKVSSISLIRFFDVMTTDIDDAAGNEGWYVRATVL
jgi:hypothetical protein